MHQSKQWSPLQGCDPYRCGLYKGDQKYNTGYVKVNFNGLANKSGVYKIVNVLDGKIYIGSAKNFKKRAYQHRSSLRNNKHQNKYLQRAFNKHGADAFLFEVIEVVLGSKEKRVLAEQKHLDKYIVEDKWSQCYNLDKKAINGGGFQKYSNNEPWNKGKTGIYSKETLQKISAALTGKKNPGWGIPRSEKTKAKISKANSGRGNGMYGKVGKQHPRSKPYAFVSPTGEIVSGVSLTNFCKLHNLQQSKMWAVLHEKRNHHKGWRKYKGTE